jgi:phage repressor protein C with HTH and peptisase S24 domain/DNA-binding XRE family transcriptional regulator
VKTKKAPLPDWARKILALREALGLTQAAFASRLHYSAMALSRWERGTHEPPAQCYIQLGNISGEPQCWWFWARAGFKSTDLSRIFPEGHGELRGAKFPELEIVAAGAHKRLSKMPTKARLVAIPVLALHAATHGAVGDHVLDLDSAPVTEMLAAPDMWCPNPGETNCLRVRGGSMSPIINEDDIVAVDCAQTDPKQLSGKIIVTWQEEHGLVLSRFLLVNGTQLLESENRAYEPVRLGKNRNWRIIGRVLWWIRQAP